MKHEEKTLHYKWTNKQLLSVNKSVIKARRILNDGSVIKITELFALYVTTSNPVYLLLGNGFGYFLHKLYAHNFGFIKLRWLKTR